MKYYFSIIAACLMLFSCNNKKSASKGAEHKTIMAIFAHPDDEVDVSPLLTKLASEGHTVYLTIATRGDMGVREHAKIPAGDSLANVRARETECACKIMGINLPIMLGLGDGKLTDRKALSLLRERLDSILAIYKPDIVITWGAEGGSGHPDHRMVGAVVTEILQSGQSVAFPKLFYTAIPTEHWRNMPPYQSEISKEYHRNYNPVEEKYLPVRILTSEMENKIARKAMRCYVSQYPPEELDDNELWMENMNKDTVYLRPYTNTGYISNDIFE